MFKEKDYIRQREAPKAFGTHFVNIEPFKEYNPAFKYYFRDLLPKNLKSSPKILDAACGNENRVIAGMEVYAKNISAPLEIKAVDTIIPKFMSDLPSNIKREIIQADLKQKWQFPDNCFDGIVFTWALHWFGLEGSQNALDELARVLKPGASALISTLTPYDSSIKNLVFLKTKTAYKTILDEIRVPIKVSNISKKELQKIYPDAKIVSSHNQDSKPTWVVRRGEKYVREQIKNNGGYLLKQGHPLSNIGGDKTMIGFTPEYLKEELKKRGLEIVMENNRPNDDFPNYTTLGKRFQPTLPKGRTKLIIIVRKIIKND